MELAQYLLIILLCLAAIPAGMLIGALARSEIAPGLRWFRWLQRLLLVIMLVLAVRHALFAPWLLGLLAVMVMLLLLPRTFVLLNQLAPGSAVLFPLLLFGARGSEIIGVFAALVIVFHLIQGTLWIGRQDRRMRYAIIHALVFAVLSVALWFLQ